MYYDIVSYLRSITTCVGVPHGNEYKFRCPFARHHAHGDRNPSFLFNAALGVYICFGANCQRKGGILSLFWELTHYGYSPPRNIFTVAGRSDGTKDTDQEERWKPSVDEIALFNKARQYYIDAFHSELGKPAREYITKRQLSVTVAEQIGVKIGFAPTTDFLSQLFGTSQLDILHKYGLTWDNGNDVLHWRVLFMPDTPYGWMQGRAIQENPTLRYMSTCTPKPIIGFPPPDDDTTELIVVEGVTDGVTAKQYFDFHPIILNGGGNLPEVLAFLKPKIEQGLVYNGLDQVGYAISGADCLKDYPNLKPLDLGGAKDINEAYVRNTLGIAEVDHVTT